MPDSPWRIGARAGLGDGRFNTISVSSSVAVMCYATPDTKIVAFGVGFDLLGTINQDSHPRETWNETFYGPSFRVAVEKAGMLLEGYVSYGVRGSRAHGDTPQEYAAVSGFNLSYLWGR